MIATSDKVAKLKQARNTSLKAQLASYTHTHTKDSALLDRHVLLCRPQQGIFITLVSVQHLYQAGHTYTDYDIRGRIPSCMKQSFPSRTPSYTEQGIRSMTPKYMEQSIRSGTPSYTEQCIRSRTNGKHNTIGKRGARAKNFINLILVFSSSFLNLLEKF